MLVPPSPTSSTFPTSIHSRDFCALNSPQRSCDLKHLPLPPQVAVAPDLRHRQLQSSRHVQGHQDVCGRFSGMLQLLPALAICAHSPSTAQCPIASLSHHHHHCHYRPITTVFVLNLVLMFAGLSSPDQWSRWGFQSSRYYSTNLATNVVCVDHASIYLASRVRDRGCRY